MSFKFIARYFYLGEEIHKEEIEAPTKVMAEFKAKVRAVAYGNDINRKLKYKVDISENAINTYGFLIDCKNIHESVHDQVVKNIS